MARAPAFLAAVAFAAGVWLGASAWRPPLWWMAAIVVLDVAALVLVRPQRMPYAWALLALAALGALDLGARDQSRAASPQDPQLATFLNGEEVLVTGHVVRDSTSRARGSSTSEVVDVESHCISQITYRDPAEEVAAGGGRGADVVLSEEGPSVYETMPRPARKRSKHNNSVTSRTPVVRSAPCLPVAAGIRLTAYPHDVSEDNENEGGELLRPFHYGEHLRFVARLRPPRNFGNPGAWDYVGYLRDSDIIALGAARADRLERLPGFTGTRIGDMRARVRRSVLSRIDRLWYGPRAALIAPMVVGDKSDLRRDVRNDFQRTGVYHILVVSGMNVGIIAFVIFWVLRRLRIGDLTCSVLTVVLSCGYALITDGGAPILRATLMLAIYLGARLLYRERAGLNAVGLAALILLVVDPRALFEASFQLTFVSVAAIAGIAVPLLELTAEPYRRATRHLDSLAYDLTLPPRLVQFRLDLRLLEGKAAALTGKRLARFGLVGSIRACLAAAELFVVSAIAQCALALPMAVYFHRAVLVGLPANLIVVPLTGILMPAGSVAVALDYVSPTLAKPAAWIAAWSLDAITETIRVVGGWRASDWRIAPPDTVVAIACVAAVALCIVAMRRSRWAAATGIALLVASAASVALLPPRKQVYRGRLEFTVLDVGQADSTLLVTPEGRTLLVDAAGSFGPFQSEFDFGEDVISPYLWSRGITRLDAVALTHAHADHIGGMRSVLANFRPRELWVGTNAPNSRLDELLQQTRSLGVKVKTVTAQDRFEFGGALFEVLSPPPGWMLRNKVNNEDSLVLRVSYGGTSALITGDADRKMERLMLAAEPRATLLHVAHNGSASSTSREFLETLQPRYAVISVGARNQFRHPRQEVLERLAAQRVATYRTDVNGAVSFFLDGEKVRMALRETNPR